MRDEIGTSRRSFNAILCPRSAGRTINKKRAKTSPKRFQSVITIPSNTINNPAPIPEPLCQKRAEGRGGRTGGGRIRGYVNDAEQTMMIRIGEVFLRNRLDPLEVG
ncbi:hypothetical protein CEXT_651931 [Caerostris extrusa]|uniref:Uncharacterized protein n=1 Tax=Caerostris extrusa TaxID=172846 RepID=A0AAV4WVD4_CAEEX|nr:hypothetical protein CEXT_651931 [Caerostris extrusa]